VKSPANTMFEHTNARYYLHVIARCTPSCPASSVDRWTSVSLPLGFKIRDTEKLHAVWKYGALVVGDPDVSKCKRLD